MAGQKVVLITGCSTGIGLVTAVMLAKDAEKRFKVYATMRNLAKKEMLEKEGSDVLGKTLFIEKLDVSSDEQIEKAIDDLIAKEGRIDVLVNNAGFGWFGPVESQESSNMESMFATNVYGPIKLIKKLLPSWKKSGSGQAITVTSIGGLVAFPFSSVYVSTKFAVEGFVEGLALELAEHPNIRVNLVEPGPVYTQFGSNAQIGNLDQFKSVDETTMSLMKKMMTLAAKSFEGMGQTGEDIGKVILEVITSDKPKLRYMTNPKYSELLLSKYTDLTGDKPFKAMSDHFFNK